MGLTPYESLTIDGKNCSDFGVWISGGGTYNAPPRSLENVSIPGRNGDLHFDNGRFQNITVTYPAFIARRFNPRMDDFREWLCSKYHYVKIEDSYHPDEYRLARIVNVSTSLAAKQAGLVEITADVKPQRFITTDNAVKAFSSNVSPVITYYVDDFASFIKSQLQIAAGLAGYTSAEINAMQFVVIDLQGLIGSTGYIRIEVGSDETLFGIICDDNPLSASAFVSRMILNNNQFLLF